MNIKQQFDKNGAVWPIKIFEKSEIESYKQAVLDSMAKLDLMNSDYRCKSQVLFPWLDKIVHDKRLGDVIEQILGPNFHCWDTLFWVKSPNDDKFVSFHQDATYWNFAPKEKAITVWLAFNDVTKQSGAIEYILGSHEVSQEIHNDIKNDKNLLMRGQTIDHEISDLTVAEVPAGCVTIHSPYMIHGSGPNKSDDYRIACGMIFVSTECKPIASYSPESTIMVRGVDEYNHMMHDPRPTGQWSEDVKNWRAAYDRQHENYYKMTLDNAKKDIS